MEKLTVIGGATCGVQMPGACYLLESHGFRILLDCGGNISYQNPPKIPDPQTVDLIYISHAHVDHIGALAYIASICPNAQIYMTNLTKMFTKYQLEDVISQKIGAYSPAQLFNNEILVRMLLNRVYTVEENQPGIALSKDSACVRHTFLSAGHAPGAAMIYLDISDESGRKKILYTGDFADFATQLTFSYEIGFPGNLKPDVLILGATHANAKKQAQDAYYSDATDVVEEKLIAELKKFPRFSLKISSPMKSLEFLALLYQMIKERKIPEYPIFMEEVLWNLTREFAFADPSLDVSHIGTIDEFKQKKPPKAILITTLRDKSLGQRFEFSLHASYKGLVTLIEKTKAAKVFVVHTSATENKDRVLATLVSNSIITYTENGHEYPI